MYLWWYYFDCVVIISRARIFIYSLYTVDVLIVIIMMVVMMVEHIIKPQKQQSTNK
jgi:hypothetical protein